MRVRVNTYHNYIQCSLAAKVTCTRNEMKSPHCDLTPSYVNINININVKTPWYNSYCQTSGSCHSELPPACVKDTDCSRPAAKAAKAAPVQVEQIEQIFASLS